MSPEKMIMMANQIATFFNSQPGDRADKVADHLRDYWEPRMRDQLRQYIADGGQGLDPLVTEASARL
ncbi:formate dehydrogenase subunit delta [Paracoccus caeni]|uniref:Formate dehydrogenase subunit delta n=1 Tax=Paracoccus caeni TaxID=657651 RepID=A0A934W2I9_9RHOB|nr:formate dehydrogenase subunit delta [Paracoccus caeni]MBK4217829.1 formate dehydrogenase subunit delta [Paracoccus caeni]